MGEKMPRKPLFIHAQDWYRATVCVDCPEFNFVPLLKGAVAYCDRVEEDKVCIFHPDEGEKEDGLDASTLLDLEIQPRIEAS